jgi:hypothetical protein
MWRRAIFWVGAPFVRARCVHLGDEFGCRERHAIESFVATTGTNRSVVNLEAGTELIVQGSRAGLDLVSTSGRASIPAWLTRICKRNAVASKRRPDYRAPALIAYL